MPEVGDNLGRYTLLRKLAAGGMGEIFLAARAGPLGFGPPVALKVLRDELASDDSFIEMLVDEANISRFLNHQNVVSVLDFGEDAATYYIAMEFVQGMTLQELLEQLRQQGRRLDVALAMYVATELCRALKYAHTRRNHAGEPLNIIHRDVTPGNVLLSIQGEVKLTDFGIARAKGRSHQTQAGVLKGKFGYMAPEMLRYETIDARADLFCAGVVTYEMLAGQHPVQGASIIDAIEAFEEKNIKPVRTYNPSVPPALSAILMKALEPNPDARWSSAADLGNALQDLSLADESFRREVGIGASRLSDLMRSLKPEVFDNPIPRDVADRLLADARRKEAAAARALDLNIEDSTPTPQSPQMYGGGNDARRLDAEPSTTAPFRLDREAPELPTAQALEAVLDDDDDLLGPPTLSPGHDYRTEDAMRPITDSDPHPRLPSGLGLGDDLIDSATVDAAADDPRGPSHVSTVNLQGLTEQATPNSPGAYVGPDGMMRFPDEAPSGHDLLAEQPLMTGGDSTIPVNAVSKDALERYLRETGGDADEKTVAAGMALPFGRPPTHPPPPGPPSSPSSGFATREERPVYEEAELPGEGPSADPAYDDAETAFTGAPAGFEQDPFPASMGPPVIDDYGDAPTIIPDVDPPIGVGRQPGLHADATLLDQISAEDVARAKQQYMEQQLDVPIDFDDDDMDDGATRIRPDSFGDALRNLPNPLSARAGVDDDEDGPTKAGHIGARARQLTGPLRIKVKQDGTPGLASSPAFRAAPTPSNGGAAAYPAGADVGNTTNEWMQGQVPASQLSWGDEDAARRLVATRNAGAQGGPQGGVGTYGSPNAAPKVPPGAAPPPPVFGLPPAAPPLEAPPIPQPPHGIQPGLQAQAGLQPSSSQPQASISTVPQPPAKRKGPAPLIAMGLVILAILTGLGVFAMTDRFWPTIKLSSTPARAEVYLNGKPVGAKTPVTLSVKPWVEHRLVLKLEGYPDQMIDPGSLSPLGVVELAAEFKLDTRVVQITPKSGTLFINDRRVGIGTRIELPDLEGQGSIELKVESTGFKTWTQKFATADEIPGTVDVQLEQK